MADPKKAGEQADRMIAEQHRLQAEAVAAMTAEATAKLEDQTAPPAAIPAETVTATPDVSVPAPNKPESNPELEAMREQVRVKDQQWKVLQGMISKKDSEIENMRALLAQVSQKQAEQTEHAPSKTPSTAVTAQEVEDFGQDMIDLISKISADTFTRMSGQISSQISEMKKSVAGIGETTARTAADIFDADLTKRVPSWEQINTNPDFLEWVQEVDDFTGMKRIELLNDAYSKMDLNRTAKFFEIFLKGKPAPVVATPAEPVAVPDATKLVVPGKSRSAATPPANDTSGHIWTKDDITSLYSDHRTGKLGKEEFDRLERDLFKAQRENRLAA